MGPHSVTCHSTQVNAPRLTPATHDGTRFTYPGGMEGSVGLVDSAPAWNRTSDLSITSPTPNHCTTRRLVPAERRDRRPGRSATRLSGTRYCGASPCKTLHATGKSLRKCLSSIYMFITLCQFQWQVKSTETFDHFFLVKV